MMSLHDINNRHCQGRSRRRPRAGIGSADRGQQGSAQRTGARVLEQGHRCFGENKVQEAAGKWPDFREKFDGIDLHLIGPLQTNKARQAMELFDAIHSVDRPKLAKTIARLPQEWAAALTCSFRSTPAKKTRKRA